MQASVMLKMVVSLALFHCAAFVGQFQVPSLDMPSFDIASKTDVGLKAAHFGTAGFSVTDPNLWFTIDTNSYPELTLLSQGRNKGFTEGRIYLSPTGFTIGEAGNYWVSISAILQNPTDNSTILVPVFLARDEAINQDDNSLIGGVVTLESNLIRTVQAEGILKNVAEGERFSLVATNAGYPLPQPVVVVAWGISLYKLAE
jgi:hypothetical protein